MPIKENKNRRGAGIFLSYANTFVNMFCGIILSSYLIRILGDVEYGIYQTISSFANYLVLLEFGVGTVMTRNISLCRSRGEPTAIIERNVSTLWSITVVLSCVIGLVSVGFYMGIDSIYAKTMTGEQIVYAKTMFLIITIYLLASFFLQTLNGAVLAFEKYTFSSTVSLIRTLTRTAVLLLAIYAWRYAVVIALTDMALSIATTLYTYLYCRKKLNLRFTMKQFDRGIFHSSIGLCIAIFLQVIINQSNNNVDKFIIGFKMSPEAVSVYSVGMYIYSIFSSLTTIPISMYAPEVAKNVSSGLRGRGLTDSLINPCRLIALIGGTVLFGFAGIGRQFITILYGEQYLQAWYIAILIMVPMFINMSNGVIVNVLDVMNKRMVRSLILLGTTLANIIMTLFFVDAYGIVGAAAATAICTLFGQVLIMNIYYKWKIGINVLRLFKETYRGILGYQFMGMLAAIAIGYVVPSVGLSFVLGGIAFVIITLGGFLLMGANKEERHLLNNLLKRG